MTEPFRDNGGPQGQNRRDQDDRHSAEILSDLWVLFPHRTMLDRKGKDLTSDRCRR
jgi:hypothetical protein